MSEYVTNSPWARAPGRPDAIDDVADQFERPTTHPPAPPTGQTRTASELAAARWPRSARGWRSAGRLHPAPGSELAPS